MRSLTWKLCLAAGVSCLALFGNAAPGRASEDVPGGPDERLQRMEQRINALAERQEQAQRRFEAALAAGGQMERQPGAPPERQGPATAPAPATILPANPAPGANAPAAAKFLRDIGGMMRLMLLGCIVCNLLLAIWIFTDIRKRGEGSGIFVALALVAGIPAALIYSLVRIGDKLAVNGK